MGLMTKFPHLIINPYFTILFYGKKGVIFYGRNFPKTWRQLGIPRHGGATRRNAAAQDLLPPHQDAGKGRLRELDAAQDRADRKAKNRCRLG